MRLVYDFFQRVRERRAQAKAMPKAAGGKAGKPTDAAAPDAYVDGAHVAKHDVWVDLIGVVAAGESAAPADFDTFRKRYRESDHEFEKTACQHA